MFNSSEEKSTPGTFTTFTRQPLVLVFIALILLVGSFLAGLGIGFGFGRWSNGNSVLAQTSVGGHSQSASADLHTEFGTFWEAMDLLYRDFYGDRPDAEEATYSAIRSVIADFDDPNTSFMTPQEAETFRTNIQGEFEGIGARVAWNEEANTVVVTEPFENQPAWSAGIRRDDLILEVDGESVIGTSLTDAVQKIRGPKGSVVVLTIAREDEEELLEIEVVRDRIEIPTISTESYGDNNEFAYVRLNSFNENAGQLVKQAYENAMEHEPQGLIFDLRGNSGGLLREAVKVANVFLEDEVVLLERFSDGEVKTYETTGEAVTAAEIPLIVLVNGGSASASEIVAGVLQDTARGALLGTTTFGKGSVQLPHRLSNGGIMRVTIARWFTPKDRSIDGIGLEPDIVVEISDEDREAGNDPQLDAALEYLAEQMQQ